MMALIVPDYRRSIPSSLLNVYVFLLDKITLPLATRLRLTCPCLGWNCCYNTHATAKERGMCSRASVRSLVCVEIIKRRIYIIVITFCKYYRAFLGRQETRHKLRCHQARCQTVIKVKTIRFGREVTQLCRYYTLCVSRFTVYRYPRRHRMING